MQNELIKQVTSDLLAAIEIIKLNPAQTDEKNYKFYFLKFFREEVAELRQPFRKLFKKCGCTVGLRKYFIAGADGVKIEYEARFKRFGLNIVVRSENLTELKKEFIKAANSACGGEVSICVN